MIWMKERCAFSEFGDDANLGGGDDMPQVCAAIQGPQKVGEIG